MKTSIREKIIESMGASSVLSKNILSTMENLGEQAIPGLIDVMQDMDLMNEDSTGEGFIPILAAKGLSKNYLDNLRLNCVIPFPVKLISNDI